MVLWDCAYENLKFRRPWEQIEKTLEKLEDKRNEYIVGTLILDEMMERIGEVSDMEDRSIKVEGLDSGTEQKKQKSVYVNLLNRQREPSMEERQKNI